MPNASAIDLLQTRAAAAGIPLTAVTTMQEVALYALDLCKHKAPYEPLLPPGAYGDTQAFLPGQEVGKKIIAAPDFDAADFAFLAQKGEELGFTILQEGLRNCMAGLDVTITQAVAGVAETATCVMDCAAEEARLASMLTETHIVVLPRSTVCSTLYEAEQIIESLQKQGPRFISFISGSSRTADIELVLALGAHGPLDFHILLLDA